VVLASPRLVELVSSDTHGSLSVAVERHSSLALSGGYLVSGGLTASDQEVIPERFGPHAEASFTAAVSRTDGLTTAATAQELTSVGNIDPTSPTPARAVSNIGRLDEILRHNLSAVATFTADGGIAVTSVQTTGTTQAPAVGELVFLPVVTVSFVYRFGHKGASEAGLSAGLAPLVDYRTGRVSERLNGSATYSENLTSDLSVHYTATVVQSIDVPKHDPYALTLLTGSAEARLRLTREVDMSIGVTAFWQTQSSYGTALSQIGLVSVTGRLPTLQF
jgi:hypothetical protein